MPCLGSSQHQHDGPPASAEVADDDHGVPLASAETIELGAPHLTSGNGLCPEPPLGTLEGEVQVRRQERAQHPHIAMAPLDLKIGAHHPPRDRTHLLIGQSAPAAAGSPARPNRHGQHSCLRRAGGVALRPDAARALLGATRHLHEVHGEA
jgi:hypothetical protein